MSKQHHSESKLQIKEHPKNHLHINKRLLLWILLLVLLFIATLFFLPFQKRKTIQKQASHTDSLITIPIKTIDSIDPQFATLPNSYQNRKKVQGFLPEIIPKAITNRINQLQDNQKRLQGKLKNIIRMRKETHTLPPKKQTLHKWTQAEKMVQEHLRNSHIIFRLGPSPFRKSTLRMSQALAKKKKNKSTHVQAVNNAAHSSQQSKLNFLSHNDSTDIYDSHHAQQPLSPYIIQAGSIVKAALITAVNSSMPSTLVAQTQSDIYDTPSGSYLLIPKGSKLIGTVDINVNYGQKRILAAFNRIIRPDGSSIQINKTGAGNMSGEGGLKAHVNNHWGKVFGAALISTLLSVPATYMAYKGSSRGNYQKICTTDSEGSDTCHFVFVNDSSSSQQALIQATKPLTDIGSGIVSKMLTISPELTLPQGYEFNIILKKDIIIPPYHQEQRY